MPSCSVPSSQVVGPRTCGAAPSLHPSLGLLKSRQVAPASLLSAIQLGAYMPIQLAWKLNTMCFGSRGSSDRSWKKLYSTVIGISLLGAYAGSKSTPPFVDLNRLRSEP